MIPDIVVDAGIALEADHEVASENVVVARYDGPSMADDRQVLEYVAELGARVLVVVGDSYLVADELHAYAGELDVTLAITRTTNPMDAAQHVLEHASELRLCERGITVRVMASGLEAVVTEPESVEVIGQG